MNILMMQLIVNPVHIQVCYSSGEQRVWSCNILPLNVLSQHEQNSNGVLLELGTYENTLYISDCIFKF